MTCASVLGIAVMFGREFRLNQRLGSPKVSEPLLVAVGVADYCLMPRACTYAAALGLAEMACRHRPAFSAAAIDSATEVTDLVWILNVPTVLRDCAGR